MKVFANMRPRLALAEVAGHARRVEALGYDGLHVAETVHDPFVVSALCLEHTERIRVRTSVALAFVRSPLLTAYSAWGLAGWSGGRFDLGLGTQIRQNIEERYGMPWGDPVGRMADYIAAVRAAFVAFAGGDRPAHMGPYYRLTRLQPEFDPGPNGQETVPVWLGGVNAGITRLAGAVADGFVTHPTNSSPRFIDERCLPALAAGADEAGRDLAGIELVAGGPIATGPTDAAVTEARAHQRRTLAFLYSTPAYAPTLTLHGWDDLGGRLRDLVRADAWDRLGDVLTDEVLDAIVPTATYPDLADALHRHLGDRVDGVLVPPPADPADDEPFAAVVADLRAR